MGCGLPSFCRQNMQMQEGQQKKQKYRLKGYERLFTILVSESAHLIWKIRCERLIKRNDDPEQHHTKDEIINKWMLVINTRLKYDILHTNSQKYGKKAVAESLVLKTWSGILREEQNLPDNWIRQSGGLVGIEVADVLLR